MDLIFIISLMTLLSTMKVDSFLKLPTDADVQFKEDIYIYVKEGKRTRRSADDIFHPETFDLNLTVEGLSIHMHLKRNDHIKTKVPTLTVRSGSIKSHAVSENEESVFYQDIQTGAVLVMQSDQINSSSMFGVFHAKGEEYIIQSPDEMPNSQLRQRYSKFHIFKEKHQNVTFNDLVQKEITETKIKIDSRKRHKRAAGAYRLELLIVVDYSIYQFWYDKSTKPTHGEKDTESITTIRQFYAFIINGMDAMYKNIQTTSYSIAIEFAGIIIAQTPSDSSWTETIKVTSVSPYQVDSSDALTNFKSWVQSTNGNLPGHDHAMLFTRYDLTSSGSTSNAGLAYVGAVCTNIGQSIVEDHFNFVMLTVAAHELGHSLSASHDGEGNGCSFSDAYIMASSSSPQTPGSAIATNPWKFSSCSTNYFTTYIDTLETNSANCMLSLSPGFNDTALSEFDNDVAGQVYDAHLQCENIVGPGSYLCTDRYSGDFSSICTVMWCAIPDQPGYCTTTTAAEGTLCGNQKWCVTGSCVYDAAAPTGSSSCLYGDKRGPIYSNQPWNCSVIAQDYSYNCPNLPTKCCNACAPYLPSTTTSGSTPSPPSTTSSVSSTSGIVSTQQTQLSDVDAQCESARGGGSVMCRGLYSGNFSSICTTLYCLSPSSSTCYGETASDGTLCGNHKWCISGVCTSDVNAPSGDESCLYGDKPGAVFSNGWTCADMVTNAPNNCPNNAITCCYSCAPYLPTTTASQSSSTLSTLETTSAMPLVSTSSVPNQSPDADSQCESNRGAGSFMCRGLYSGNFSSICSTLWCSNPSSNSSTCYGQTASDGTLCGNHKWCMSGVCTSDVNAPSGDESCLYGDKLGPVFTNGWTCADMVTNAPNNCPNNAITCCYSCAPYLTTTTTLSSSTTVTTLETTSALPPASTSSVPLQALDVDSQCESNRGAGSFMCRGPYNGDFTSICTNLWCANPTNTSSCLSATVTDGTLCGNNKWCLSGVCTTDSSAPLGDESCLYGDRLGPIFTNGWSCSDMVANSPNYCSLVPVDCCYSCAPYLMIPTSSQLYSTTYPQDTATYGASLSDQMQPTTSGNIPHASSSNMPPSSHMVPSSSSYAPLHSSYVGTTFSNGDMPHASSSNIPPPSSSNMPHASSSNVPHLFSSYMQHLSSSNMPHPSSSNMPPSVHMLPSSNNYASLHSNYDGPPFSNGNMPHASSSITPPPSSSNMPHPSNSNMPPSSHILPSASSYAPLHSSYDETTFSNGNMPHASSSTTPSPSSRYMPHPSSSNMPPSSHMLPSSSSYAPLHSSYDGTTFSNGNMPHASSSNIPPPSSSNMPFPSSSNTPVPSSSNMQPGSSMLPSSSNYAPVHSSYDDTTFSNDNLPHVSSSNMPQPSSSNMPQSSSGNLPHMSSSYMPLPSSSNMQPNSPMLPSSSNYASLHSSYDGTSFSNSYMPHPSSSNTPPPSSSNMPHPSSSYMPPSNHILPSSSNYAPLHSSYDETTFSNGNMSHASSSITTPPSSSNMPHPSSSNMPPSSHMLPSSSNYAPLHSSYNGTTFSNGNMPHASSSYMQHPSSSNLPHMSSSYMPLPSSSNMQPNSPMLPSSSNYASLQSSYDGTTFSNSYMPHASSSNTPLPSSSNMPHPSSSYMPPSSHILPSSSIYAPLHSSYDETTFSNGNMPHASSSITTPPSSSNMPPSSHMLPSSSNYAPLHSSYDGTTFSNGNMPHASSSTTPPPSSSNMPFPSSSNTPVPSSSIMQPSSSMLPSSSNYAPLHSSYDDTTFSNDNMPYVSSSYMQLPSSSNMPQSSSGNLPHMSSSYMPLPSSSNMQPNSSMLPSSSNYASLHSSYDGTTFSNSYMPHPSSSNMPYPSSSNMSPPSSSNMPLSSSSNMLLQSSSNMPSPSSSNMPPFSSNMPPPPGSYMPLLSSSYMSSSSSNMPPPTRSNIPPFSSIMPLPSSSYMQLPSSSNMPPSISNKPPPSSSSLSPSSSTMPSQSSNTMPQTSSSNMPTTSSSYMQPPSSSNMPTSSSNMPTPNSNMPPLSSSNMPPTSSTVPSQSSINMSPPSSSNVQSSSAPTASTTIISSTTTTKTKTMTHTTTPTSSTPPTTTTTSTTQSIPTTTTTTTPVAQLVVLNFDSGAVVPFQRVISIVITIATVGILKYVL